MLQFVIITYKFEEFQMAGVRLSRISLKLGLALVPFMSFRIGTTALSDVLLVVAIFFVIPSILRYHSSKVFSTISASYFVIFTSGILASLLSDDPANSALALLKFLIMIFGYTLLIRYHLLLGSSTISFLNAYLYGAAIFSLQYVVGYYTIFEEQSFGRFEGLSDHVTNAAGSILIGIAINLNAVLKRSFRPFNSFLQLLLLWALILTGSISSFIAFTITLFVAAMYHPSAKLRSLVLLYAIAGVSILLVQKLGIYDFVERFRSATSGRYNTSQSRVINWSSSLEGIFTSFRSLLLGNGLDKDSGLVQSRNFEILQVHNSFLQLIYQGGLIFSAGIVFLISKALYVARQLTVSDARILIYPCTSALIFSMTSPLMNSRYIWFPFLVALSNLGLRD